MVERHSDENTPLPNRITDALHGTGAVSVYFHDLYSLPSVLRGAKPVVGWRRFAERAIVLARPNDIVCVETPPDESYLDYLQGVGLEIPRTRILSVAAGDRTETPGGLAGAALKDAESRRQLVDLLDGAKSVGLHPYFPAHSHFDLAERLRDDLGIPVTVPASRPEVARRTGRKDVVRNVACRTDIPVAEGKMVHAPVGQREALEKALREVRAETGRVIVRGVVGDGGSATFFLGERTSRLPDMLASEELGKPPETWLVEAHYEHRCSPNVQFFVDPKRERIAFLGMTDQRLDAELGHIGNAWPSHAQTRVGMIDAGRELAEWYLRSGGAGIIGADFVEYPSPRSGRPRFILAELNPRVNGATYPLSIVARLNRRQPRVGGFVSGHIPTDCRSFDDLKRRLGGLLYDKDSGVGLVPYNIGTLQVGRFDAVACETDRHSAESLWQEALRR